MYYKPVCVFLFASVAVLLAVSPGFCQCHNGHCNTNVVTGIGPNGYFGGFGANGPGVTAPIQVGPIVGPFGNPVGEVVQPFGAKGTPSEPDFELAGGQTYDVVIDHPLSQRTIKVQSFTNRGQAAQFVNQLETRFWIMYTDRSGQAAFREAKTSGEINAIVSELRGKESEVSSVKPVVARIVNQQDTSLEALLGNQNSQSVPAPLTTVQQSVPVLLPPPAASAQPRSAEDTGLDALEGIWAAVARSADGELRRVELKLDSGGWARLSIPDGAGKTTTIDRRAVVEDGQLKLKDGDQEMLLGQLSQVEADQFVVTRADGQVTFLKQ